MHGSLVTSLAVGRSVGVAPDAKVYYIASTFGKITEDGPELDLSTLADAILHVMDINEALPENEKIAVISISRGLDVHDKGYTDVINSIEKAKEAGIFVITTTPFDNYGFKLYGLGRALNDDPNVMSSYGPSIFLRERFYDKPEEFSVEKDLWVPMDSRTYAFSSGVADYAFNSVGGNSLTPPWLAGLYALCIQIRPDVTFDVFIRTAFGTGSIIKIQHEGNYYYLGKIINPVLLVERLKNN